VEVPALWRIKLTSRFRVREIVKMYVEELQGIPGIGLHPVMPWAKGVYWLYSILIDSHGFGANRDHVMEYLARCGIETRRFFYPLHTMPLYKQYIDRNTRYQVSEYLSEYGLNLSSEPRISDEEVIYVAETIKRFYRELHPQTEYR
jgi:perosamine synthetase